PVASKRCTAGSGRGPLEKELLSRNLASGLPVLRHGACRVDEELIELVLWPADGHYWLAVSDPGTGKPALARPDADSESGRGLVLVDSLAAAWAVRPRPTCGTSVIAGLALQRSG
ncbi:ATP-binding protein, partial [Streptomyces sp. NPDC050617]|uniref:ATP-binding protein n=1 Tax=Streptomyces sp. NPDC050617 TaxID=3154628 RepID=UPI003448FB30